MVCCFTSHMLGKPDNVKSPVVTASSMNTLTVEWTPGYDGGEEQWFLVAYRLLPDGTFGDFERQENSKHTIEDLLPGKEYEIMIFSANKHGKSRSGELVTGRTRRKFL